MKKLNNRGWGLGSMIIFMCILLVFIIIIAVESKRLGIAGKNNQYVLPTAIPISTPTNTPTSTPTQYTTENKDNLELIFSNIKTATEAYISQNYGTLIDGDTIYISVQRLITDQLIEEVVYDSSKCTGYVEVTTSNSIRTITPYLKCGNYTSENYDAKLD